MIFYGYKIGYNMRRVSCIVFYRSALCIFAIQNVKIMFKSRYKEFYVCASNYVHFEINPRNSIAFTL